MRGLLLLALLWGCKGDKRGEERAVETPAPVAADAAAAKPIPGPPDAGAAIEVPELVE